jgi:hypothetical protein
MFFIVNVMFESMYFTRFFLILVFSFLWIEKAWPDAERPHTLLTPLQESLCPLPYEAIYQLDLESTSPESLTEEANGVLSVKFQDVGNGWTLQQQGSVRIQMAPISDDAEILEGGDNQPEASDKENLLQKVRWSYVTWEAKNGRHFRFILHRWIDGILEEEVEGEMVYDPLLREGKITYQSPTFLAQPFYGEVLFPTAYMGKILEKIRCNGGLVSSLVFNGLCPEGVLLLNTFVGGGHNIIFPIETSRAPGATVLKPQHMRVYPTFTASYHPKAQEEQPESEMSQELTATGLPMSSILNFGDFKLRASLKTVSPPPKHSLPPESKGDSKSIEDGLPKK